MKLTDISTFEVVSENMEWPWFAFDASGSRFAYAASETTLATQHYDQ